MVDTVKGCVFDSMSCLRHRCSVSLLNKSSLSLPPPCCRPRTEELGMMMFILLAALTGFSLMMFITIIAGD